MTSQRLERGTALCVSEQEALWNYYSLPLEFPAATSTPHVEDNPNPWLDPLRDRRVDVVISPRRSEAALMLKMPKLKVEMDKCTSFAAAPECVRWLRLATFMVFSAATLLIASGCEKNVASPAAAKSMPSVVSAPSAPSAPVVPATHTCLITGTAIGPLQLGVSLDEAHRLMPQATFTRTSDGEGVALVAVSVDGASLAVLYAGEEDPEEPVDVTRRIEFLETFNPACATTEGIHPGSTVETAASSYGSIRSISRSEIEAREYVQFEDPPAGLQFRLDEGGEFAKGASETSRHAPGAKIFSISVSKR